MFNCGWCGAEVAPGLEYCPNCGNLYTATQTCEKCGAQVPINVRLCSSCGTFLDGAALDVASTGIRPPASQAGPIGMQGGAPGYYTRPPAGAGRAQQKELWMKGQPVDPWYIAAVSLAVAAAVFYWVPVLGIILAIAGMPCAAMGYLRFWKMPGEHSGLWLNIAATVVMLTALIFSIKWTGNLTHTATHTLLYFRCLWV